MSGQRTFHEPLTRAAFLAKGAIAAAALDWSTLPRPERCRLRMMPAREPQPDRQLGVSGKTDHRWDAIWRLVLEAEQLPTRERNAFLELADTDPFIIRQAMA